MQILRWSLQASVVQLFLTLISLPILVGWGLPISYLTPIGTLFFTPILTIYLWCALLVFFTTLLHIPNGIFITMLSYISDWWLWILSLIKTPCTLGFVSPPLPVLCLIPLTSFFLVLYLHKKALWITLCALASLLCFWMGVLSFLPHASHLEIPYKNNKTLSVFINQNHVTVLDSDGSCSSMPDAANWILYTVLPAITQKTGATRIDRFIVLHPRQRTFKALTTLCTKGILGDVYIPYWHGHIPQSAFYAYKKLKNTLKHYNQRLSILKDSKPFIIDKKNRLHATSIQKKYADATYPLFALDNNCLTSY